MCFQKLKKPFPNAGKGFSTSSRPVSRVLFPLRVSIINLPLTSLPGCNNLPIPTLNPPKGNYTEASSLTFGTYLVFQLLGFTAMYVAIQGRELLPRVFTLTQLPERFIFCGTCRRHCWRLPVRKQDALCCPDFPPHV